MRSPPHRRSRDQARKRVDDFMRPLHHKKKPPTSQPEPQDITPNYELRAIMSSNGFSNPRDNPSRSSTPGNSFGNIRPAAASSIFGNNGTPTARPTGFPNAESLAPGGLFGSVKMEENTNPFLRRPADSTGSPWSTQAQAGDREGVLFGTKTVEVNRGGFKSGTATSANSVAICGTLGGVSFGKTNSAAPITPKKQINAQAKMAEASASASAQAVKGFTLKPSPGAPVQLFSTDSTPDVNCLAASPQAIKPQESLAQSFSIIAQEHIQAVSITAQECMAQALSAAKTSAVNGFAASSSNAVIGPGFSFGSTATPRPSASLSRVLSAQKDDAYSYAAARKSSKKTVTSFSAPPIFVKFFIGEQNQVWIVHKERATIHSSFFKEAFDGNQEEAKTQEMFLPEVDGSTFGLLNHYLYTEEVEDQACTIAESSADHPNGEVSSDPLPLVRLYLLAQRCRIIPLQNLIVPRLIPILTRSTDTSIQQISTLIFPAVSANNTNKKSPLQSLLVDHVALCQRSQQDSGLQFSELMALLPVEMVIRVAARLRGLYDTTFVLNCNARVVVWVEDYLVDFGGA